MRCCASVRRFLGRVLKTRKRLFDVFVCFFQTLCKHARNTGVLHDQKAELPPPPPPQDPAIRPHLPAPTPTRPAQNPDSQLRAAPVRACACENAPSTRSASAQTRHSPLIAAPQHHPQFDHASVGAPSKTNTGAPLPKQRPKPNLVRAEIPPTPEPLPSSPQKSRPQKEPPLKRSP